MGLILVCLACAVGLVLVVSGNRDGQDRPRRAVLPGEAAELSVSVSLRGLGPEWTVLDNLVLETGNPSFPLTEVDHVAVGPGGVFVVETKDRGGTIVAGDGKWWTQYIGENVHRMYNPVRQNAGHVRAVARAIGCRSDQVAGLVVFTPRGRVVGRVPRCVTRNPARLIRTAKARVGPETVSLIVSRLRGSHRPERAAEHRMRVRRVSGR